MATTTVKPQTELRAPLHELDDGELVAAHLAGHPGAFSELYDRYHDKLVHFIARKTGDRDRAEDLVQESTPSPAAARSTSGWRSSSAAAKPASATRVRTSGAWAASAASQSKRANRPAVTSPRTVATCSGRSSRGCSGVDTGPA